MAIFLLINYPSFRSLRSRIYLDPMRCSSIFPDTNTSREYAVPDMTKSSVIVNIPPPPPPPRRPNIYGVNPSMTLAGSGPYYTISDIPNIQGVSGNNLYAVPNSEMLWKEDYSVMEFPRENLKFLEKLGEGQFGEVGTLKRHYTESL